jgi:hypothetical protein
MVKSIFKSYAERDSRDLSSIENRMPVGLTPDVIQSYREIYAPTDTAIGLRGFRFKQYGLQYEVFYKDEEGRDNPHFIVTCPTSQPYLHLEQNMGIAEKAHAFLAIKTLMGEALREHLKAPLFEIERACFNPDSGSVVRGITGIRRMAGNKKIVEHLGLGFPSDSEYEQEPYLKIMRLEWIHGTHHMVIDNSGEILVFTKGSERNPDGKRHYMARGEAIKALAYAHNYASSHNSDLAYLGHLTGFWNAAELAAVWSPDAPQPVGP